MMFATLAGGGHFFPCILHVVGISAQYNVIHSGDLKCCEVELNSHISIENTSRNDLGHSLFCRHAAEKRMNRIMFFPKNSSKSGLAAAFMLLAHRRVQFHHQPDPRTANIYTVLFFLFFLQQFLAPSVLPIQSKPWRRLPKVRW